jgi:hypothetical protein
MHRIVYDEIMIPRCAKQQVDCLIEQKVIELIDENSLCDSDKQIYNSTYQLLSGVMIDSTRPRKNLGEVCSLSMAKTISIPIFATDEKDLQPLVDFSLNTGMDNITCLRIVDIINRVKEGIISGLSRKMAKILWVISGKQKELFDSEIWPL